MLRARLTPAFLFALIVGVGALDFGLGLRGPLSIVLSAVLSAAMVPWALVAFRRGGPADRRATIRHFAFHGANAALAVAFAGAKWLVAIRGLSAGEAEHLGGSYRNYSAALVVLLALGLGLRGGRVARLLAASAEKPARVMATTFGVTSLLGGLLLALPVSVRDVSRVSLLDSIFTSTSAVCVTGLTTVNVAEAYTMTGQIVICLLMQIGCLGIMVLTAAVTLMAGRRLDARSSSQLAEVVDATSFADLKRTVWVIVVATLAIEAAGAGALYLQLADTAPGEFDAGAAGGLAGAQSASWAAIFHSVSAFSNASLSNFRSGMLPFSRDPLFCQSIGLLIVLGGAGFPVLDEIVTKTLDRTLGRRPRRTSLNTRVALSVTAALLVGLAVLTFALELGNAFQGLGAGYALSGSVFHAACARTSGFSVVDVGAMRPTTLLLTMFAMFVGGNPGSTAGGIKTTTLAAVVAAFRGELRGTRARLFDRAIPDGVVRRALGVSFLSVALLFFVVTVLMLTERHGLLPIAFETVSAFSTTGLSMGITPELSIPGKVIIILTMLIGRIGPLTFALALSAKTQPTLSRLAEERVMIG